MLLKLIFKNYCNPICLDLCSITEGVKKGLEGIYHSPLYALEMRGVSSIALTPRFQKVSILGSFTPPILPRNKTAGTMKLLV